MGLQSFLIFFKNKDRSLYKTHYLGGWLTHWLSRRLVCMMVPIRCSSLQFSCSICVLRSCSLCCFFSLQHTWLRVGGGPTSIAGRAHCTFWQVRKGLVHFLISYTTFNVDRQLARVGDQVGLTTDSKNMLLCRMNIIRLVSLPYSYTSQDVQKQRQTPCLGISPLPKDKCHRHNSHYITTPVEPGYQIINNEAPQE